LLAAPECSGANSSRAFCSLLFCSIPFLMMTFCSLPFYGTLLRFARRVLRFSGSIVPVPRTRVRRQVADFGFAAIDNFQ